MTLRERVFGCFTVAMFAVVCAAFGYHDWQIIECAAGVILGAVLTWLIERMYERR